MINFTVSAPTDVEVAVLDAGGKVVRHLAAGVLGGKKAPPLPLKPGLSQGIAWDGKDDFGKKVSGAKIRVRIGMQVKFGRLIGGDPYRIGQIMALATDGEGRLYVSSFKGSMGQNMDVLRVYTPEGRYLRTLVPGPPALGKKRASHWAESKNGELVPKNLRLQRPIFYSWSFNNKGAGIHFVAVTKQGGLLVQSGKDLHRMAADGGDVTGPRPLWSESAKLHSPWWAIPTIALSPDGRYAYIANVAGYKNYPKNHADVNAKWPQGRVYRLDLSAKGADPEKFYDLKLPDWKAEPFWLPNVGIARTAAYGLAVDGKGHVHVCDLVNGGIVELSPAGKKIGFTPTPWPERVHVEPQTGAYFVIGRNKAPGQRSKRGQSTHTLVKISGRGSVARTVAKAELKSGFGSTSALGKVGGKGGLWVGGPAGLVCFRDGGKTFEIVETGFRPRPGSQLDWNRLAVDYARDEIYVADGVNLLYRYDGKTGEGGPLKRGKKPFHGVDLAVGYNGLLYVRTGKLYSGPLERYTRELKPAPYNGGSHVLTEYIYSRYGMGYCEKGLGVGPDGSCYISSMYAFGKYFVGGFDPKGKPVTGKYLRGVIKTGSKRGLVRDMATAVLGPISSAGGGVRVDLQGNYYLGMRMLPAGHTPPSGFEKEASYRYLTGSVVKFGPEGGAVLGLERQGGKSEMPKAPRMKASYFKEQYVLENALAVYPDMGPFSGSGMGGNCVCRAPRFDVDPHGRIAMTNPITFKINLVDNAGNPIVRFGAYGNFDSQYANPNLPQGKEGKPTVATPDIPLGWPTGAGLTDRHIYVNDTYNRRAVRVDKSWDAEETCPIQ
ncbi:MAG: hypothetical protein ACYTGB_04645 [Planctomycetota bacterium]